MGLLLGNSSEQYLDVCNYIICGTVGLLFPTAQVISEDDYQ